MKHQILVIASALLTISLFTSCGKDPMPSNNPVPGGGGGGGGSTEFSLVVQKWTEFPSGMYISNFENFISNINPSHSPVIIYVEDNGDYKLLSQAQHVSYGGGDLWASTTTNDLTIFFRSNEAVPPPINIRIKIVIQ